MEYEELRARLDQDLVFGSHDERISKLEDSMLRLAEQINHADGPVAQLQRSIERVEASLGDVEAIRTGQDRLLTEIQADKSDGDKRRELLVRVVITVLGVAGTVAAALLG